MDKTPLDNPPPLVAVAKQFEHWRASRKKRNERIPAHLWQAAADLCKNHPTTHVCRDLRLSFADLKKHMPCRQHPAPMQFMQLDLGANADAWRLECERADGTRLTLTGSGPAPDIDHLLQRFFS